MKTDVIVTAKPVVRLHATLQYSHAMLVFWLAVCSEQVASSNFNLLPRATGFPRKLRGESRSVHYNNISIRQDWIPHMVYSL